VAPDPAPAPHEETSFLGFPAKPGGDPQALDEAARAWHDLAAGIDEAFAEVGAALSQSSWSGDAARAWAQRWEEYRGHGVSAANHGQEFGDELRTLARRIDEAQHEWEIALGAVAVSTAIGIGLTAFTFGISNVAARAAATAAVTGMEAACALFGGAIAAATEAMAVAAEVAAQLAVRFAVQFGVNLAAQAGSAGFERFTRGEPLTFGDLHPGQAALYAGAAVVLPGAAGRLTVGGKAVLASPAGSFATDVAVGMGTDALAQEVEGAGRGRGFDAGEVVGTGLLGGIGHTAGRLMGHERSVDLGGQEVASVSAKEFDRWRHADPRSTAKLDRTLDAVLARVEVDGQAEVVGRDPAKRLLIRENLAAGDPPDVAVWRALRRVKAFQGPINLRLTQHDEVLHRYTDGPGRGMALTTNGDHVTSEAAMLAQNLNAQGVHAWLHQKVLVEQPALVMEGRIRGGSDWRVLVVRELDLDHFHFEHPERFGASEYAAGAADTAGRLMHDASDAGAQLRPSAADLSSGADALRYDMHDLDTDVEWLDDGR
jgi:hypothetical protein